MNRAWLIGAGILALGFAVAASADSARDQEIASFLEDFQANSKETMRRLPQKWDAQGKPLPNKKFGAIAAGPFHQHAQMRDRLIGRHARLHPDVAGIGSLPAVIDTSNDDPAQVVESPETLARTLEAFEQSKMVAGATTVDAWSDHYWPYLTGVTAFRYEDPLFPQSQDWTQNRDYTRSKGHTLADLLAKNDPAAIDLLSPAEKYDALTGNVDSPLARAMWDASAAMADDDGSLDDWEGICEGWSSAAIRVPRPVHAITVPDPGGRPIKFYPADVKALSSLLWAWGDVATRFAGGQCETDGPDTDDNGRIIDPDCFDTNPATWHLIVTQQLGRLHHSFIMDATFDVEVWNQPVKQYTYSYFNPQSGLPVAQLADAKVAMADFKADKFKKYRAKSAASVVGIVMDVVYVAETDSTIHTSDDSPAQDVLTKVRYVYDLELDAQGQIIGGEWYHEAHPDFVWMPEPGQKSVSVAEAAAAGDWSGTAPLPAGWAAAAKTAADSAQPLAKIVETLEALAAH